MTINPTIQQGLLGALMQSGALGKVPGPGLGSLAAQTPEPENKPGFFDRMFPERDPMTGKQGGILANPLFRIGLNMLMRSGPQKNRTDLGQIIAGSIGDYATQRDQETAAANDYLKLRENQQAWGDAQGKRAWAEGIDPEAFLALSNPTGNPEATKVQIPTPPSAPRLGPIPKGYASYAPVIAQAELQNPDLPKGLLPAILEQESSFNPKAVGPDVVGKGGTKWNAKGIAQFSPDTAARFGIDPFNTDQAIPTAAIYLREELKRAGGDLDKALAIYGGGFVNGQITPNGRKYVESVKAKMAKYAAEKALPGSPPPAPATFPAPQPAVAAAPQPQVAPAPQSPAVTPQGAAPLPAQSQPTPPVSGETAAPAGEPPPSLPLEFDEKGRPTKSSILESLKALPLESRNQLILGAWMKAAGNKKEFAENLGTALLSLAGRRESETGGYIVGAPFEVRNKETGDVETWIIRRDGSRENITAELGGDIVSRSSRPDYDPQNAADREAVDRVASYQESPRIFGKPGTYRYDSMMAEVRKLNPKFLEKEADNVTKAIKNFTQGPDGSQVRALGTSIAHLAQYKEAVRALKNGDIPFFNMIVNNIAQELGMPEQVVAKGTGIVVADEVVRSLIRGVGSLVDRQQLQSLLGYNFSPAQAVATADNIALLIAERLDGTRRGFNVATRGLAPEVFDGMFPPGVLEYLDRAREKQHNSIERAKKAESGAKPKVTIKSVREIK